MSWPRPTEIDATLCGNARWPTFCLVVTDHRLLLTGHRFPVELFRYWRDGAELS